jgi:hypothetical protein
MANEQEQPKPTPKKPRRASKRKADAPIPYRLPDRFDVQPSALVSFGSTDGGGGRTGDALLKVDLPTADRAELSRHLVMLAGHVASTLGDQIEGASILVVTKRKKS